MRNMYYNASHCADPTAYSALVNITREERRRNRRCRSRSRCQSKPRKTPGYYPFKEAFERQERS